MLDMILAGLSEALQLANLLFALELDRRARAAGLDLRSIAAHPGLSTTELAMNTLRSRSAPGVLNTLARPFLSLIGQPPEQGALPQLYAATAPDAESGAYYGPDRLGETRGHPAPAAIT